MHATTLSLMPMLLQNSLKRAKNMIKGAGAPFMNINEFVKNNCIKIQK